MRVGPRVSTTGPSAPRAAASCTSFITTRRGEAGADPRRPTGIREQGVGRLIVGDQTFYVQSTVANVRRAGLEAAVRSRGAEFVAFDDLPRRQLRPPAARHWPEGYRIPAMLDEVDHVINLACVK